ncbi:unnamed protein product, partial [Mesorhabditis belari]|uniref:Uncharacterized protein n=1 Tax=Mesorhabditis belari TaxID=2138241 RepID=A0AAF3FJZ4_9BILA
MGDVKITISDVIEVRDGGLDSNELLALTVLAAERLPPLQKGKQLFDIDHVFINNRGQIEFETVNAEKISREYWPPEWEKEGEDDPVAASVFCWGAVLKQAGSELIGQAELFSLVNILSVAIIGTRPTPTRMAQMAKNQLRGQEPQHIVQDIYFELMGDEDENQLSDDNYSERDFEVDDIDEPSRDRVDSRLKDFDDEEHETHAVKVPETQLKELKAPQIIVEDSEPAFSQPSTTSHNKKAVEVFETETEEDDALTEESTENESDVPTTPKRFEPINFKSGFDDDFGSKVIEESPRVEKRQAAVTVAEANPFESDEEEKSPFNQSTLSGRDPFEHLDNRPAVTTPESPVAPKRKHQMEVVEEPPKQPQVQKFKHGSSEDDEIIQAEVSDSEELNENSTRSNQSRYFDEIERELNKEREKTIPPPLQIMPAIIEVPTPKPPPRKEIQQALQVVETDEGRTPSTSITSSVSAFSSSFKEDESSINRGSSPEPKKRIVKEAVIVEEVHRKGMFEKRPQKNRNGRHSTNPFDAEKDDETSSSETDTEQREQRNGRMRDMNRRRTSDMGRQTPPPATSTPTPPARRHAPQHSRDIDPIIEPPKVEQKKEEPESMDEIFAKALEERRASTFPLPVPSSPTLTQPESPQKPPRSSPQTGFRRMESGRITRRSTKRGKRGKTRAEPEFVERKNQPAIRLKAPTTKKKKMVLHRVEQTDVFVELLNGQKIEVSCRSDVVTADIFSLVVGHMNINENVFFGLSVVRDGEHFFLDDDQRLEKFAPPGWKDRSRQVGYTLHLRFRFYPQVLEFIKTDVALHELFLQLRRDILEDRLQPKRDRGLELAALALQAEFGDRPPPAVKDYFSIEYYLQRRFYQFDDQSSVHLQLSQLHDHYRGLGAKEAETRYIQVCTCLPDYGSHLHRVFRSKPSMAHGASPFDPDTGANMWIAIMPKGIIVLEEQGGVRQPLAEHVWQRTQTLQFDKKRFVIVAQRDGDHSETVFWTDHYSKSAYFVRFSASQHRFMMRMRQWKNTLKTERSISSMPDVAIEGTLQRENRYRQENVSVPDSPLEPTESLFPKIANKRRESSSTPLTPINNNHESSDSYEDGINKGIRLRNQHDKPPPTGAIFTVTLHKDPINGLGLTLVDGKLNDVPGVYVKSVAQGGAGEQSGLLVGDRLLAVNGYSLVDSDRHRAVGLVKDSGANVRIEVSRLEGVAAHARQISADSSNFNPNRPPATTSNGDRKLSASSAGPKPVSRTPPPPRKQQNKRQRAVSDFGAIGDMLPVLNSDDIIADKMKAISGLHLDESDEERGEFRVPQQHSIYSYDQTDEDTLGGVTSRSQKRNSDPFMSEPKIGISPSRIEQPKRYQQQRRSNLDWTEELDEEEVVDDEDDEDLIHVELVKNSANSLGIQISSHQDGKVCIKQVTAEPGLSANIKAGDILVAVNSISTVNRTHQEVVNLLRSPGQIVRLTLRRQFNEESEEETGERTIRVTLHKPEGGSLGLSLAKRTGFDGIFIRTIGSDSAAEKDATLRVGDRMWAIDGEEVGGSSPATLVERLKRVQGPVEIVVKRPKDLSKYQ